MSEDMQILKLDLDFDKMSKDEIKKLIAAMNANAINSNLSLLGVMIETMYPRIMQCVMNMATDATEAAFKTRETVNEAYMVSESYILDNVPNKELHVPVKIGLVLAHMERITSLLTEITPEISRESTELAKSIGAIDILYDENEKND